MHARVTPSTPPGPLPTMFERRVALLCAAAGLCLIPAIAQVGRLTVTRGAALRAEAESRLVEQRWVGTTRGAILDRRGRVLAIDRPGLDVAVDYAVISGQWAQTQAQKRARRQAGWARWRTMSAAERQGAAAAHVPEYVARLEAGWRWLARVTGADAEAMALRREEVIAGVARASIDVAQRRRAALEQRILRSGGQEASVELADAERPIREQAEPHVIVRGLSDTVAFELQSRLDAAGQAAAGAADDGGAVLPGVRVIDVSRREYPFERVEVALDRSTLPAGLAGQGRVVVSVEGATTRLVGWMRDRAFAEDIAARPRERADGMTDRGFYQPWDAVGHTGVESSAEGALRGLRGLVRKRLDTGQASSEARVPGENVRMTIDAALQARLAALMSPEVGLTTVQPWQKNLAAPLGASLPAAVVALEIATGDVLAMVSTPGFTRADVAERPGWVFGDAGAGPALNRAIAKPYPPGSIVKPLMYCAAVTEGVWAHDKTVECTGHLLEDRPDIFRCWIYKPPFRTTHTAQLGGPLGASEAIMVSCNVFFFQVARSLGPERIAAWYQRFGVGGQGPGGQWGHAPLGVGPQFGGTAGPIAAPVGEETLAVDSTEADRQEMGEPSGGSAPAQGRALTNSEAVLMGIGQGPVAWTPLHAADAYATLARGGVRILPRLRADEPVRRIDLGLDRHAVRAALDGLRRGVAEELGTGHHITVESEPGASRRETIFDLPGLTVWGKSGTADSGRRARDAAGGPVLDAAGNPVTIDHAWFVVLVGPQSPAGHEHSVPTHALAVLVEGGGSGGRVAGPLAAQSVRALVAEGYLTPATDAGAGATAAPAPGPGPAAGQG
ncbi:MAG: hypothetical protein C0475_04120 [Planctomyces sp.]|nr:hypothetical protein [Planctomyces sp.]